MGHKPQVEVIDLYLRAADPRLGRHDGYLMPQGVSLAHQAPKDDERTHTAQPAQAVDGRLPAYLVWASKNVLYSSGRVAQPAVQGLGQSWRKWLRRGAGLPAP